MRVKNLKKKFVVSFSSLVLLTGIYSTLSYATTFSGGRGDAVFGAYYDSSVQSYGYTGHYDDARANWNDTSSRVNITRTYNLETTADKYYVGTTSVAGRLGLTSYYKLNWNGGYSPAYTNEGWAYSTVAIYDNTMDDFNMTYSQRASNATHELGHTLALGDNPPTSSRSVMKQGIQTIGPQQYDKDDIHSKWGN